jgi:sulfate transport system substrate-binding protein
MRSPLSLLVALTIAASAVVGCGGSSDSSSSDAAGSVDSSKGEISLVAYSTPEVVYDEIIPAFSKTPEGKGIGFKTSYGASGDQSRAVEAGQDADYVSFSTEPDMTRLVDAGLVDSTWADTPSKGQITTSVVAFIVRKGNPKNIQSWDDLVKPGVEVLTPNPFTSGAAKWNLLGAYGAGGGGNEDPEAGLAYVDELLNDHVVAQDKSGRDALQNFINGTGDVLLSYEYEATTAQKKGEEVDYVVPDDTVKIEIDAAVTKDAPEAAKKFLDFSLSDEGQQFFADWGYRPVNEAILAKNKDKFPDPANLLTIEDFGGWEKVNEELFDLETGGTIAKLEEATGIPTED